MTDPTYTESQLHAAAQESCSCGGSSPGEGCGACDVWHFLHGGHWTNLRQPCEACEGRGSVERATSPQPTATVEEVIDALGLEATFIPIPRLRRALSALSPEQRAVMVAAIKETP